MYINPNEARVQSPYYSINQGKLAEVAQLVRRQRYISAEAVLDYCLADWPEGKEHQRWLDNAPASTIAQWVIVGYTEDEACIEAHEEES